MSGVTTHSSYAWLGTCVVQEGCLVKHEPYQHKYPYDWRTKKPTIFRTTEQWFASVAGIRSLALEAVDQVNFVPASGAVRLASMVDGRSDWCISRQRKVSGAH